MAAPQSRRTLEGPASLRLSGPSPAARSTVSLGETTEIQGHDVERIPRAVLLPQEGQSLLNANAAELRGIPSLRKATPLSSRP
jgi:hypothetical protein